MIHSINTIFFTPNGILPRHVVDHIKVLAEDSLPQGFSTVFWTDLPILSEHTKHELIEAHVTLKDYRELSHPISSEIERFVALGHSGDICAYAMASDMLRVVIPQFIPDDSLYVYMDCNDVIPLSLKRDLAKCKASFCFNRLGIAFPINMIEQLPNGEVKEFELRNDQLIILKQNNREFLSRFFEQYTQHILRTAPHYIMSDTNEGRKQQTGSISCFFALDLFHFIRKDGVDFWGVRGTDWYELKSLVDFGTYIKTAQLYAYGRTWLDMSEKAPTDWHKVYLHFSLITQQIRETTQLSKETASALSEVQAMLFYNLIENSGKPIQTQRLTSKRNGAVEHEEVVKDVWRLFSSESPCDIEANTTAPHEAHLFM